MKNTTRMTLRSALYTVLLSSSTMLAAADGGGETPGPAVTPSSPGIDQRAQAKPPGGPMILGDTQLDEIKAGQAICLDLLGSPVCIEAGLLGG